MSEKKCDFCDKDAKVEGSGKYVKVKYCKKHFGDVKPTKGTVVKFKDIKE